jgi:exodeoxyribonuclease VII small subunit
VSGEGPSFEAAFARLEEIIALIDAGELELDQALALFEEGVGLLRFTGQTLDRAELRVQQLLADEDGWTLRPFEGNG